MLFSQFQKIAGDIKSIPLRLCIGFAGPWLIWFMFFLTPSVETTALGINFSDSLYQYGSIANRVATVICGIIVIIMYRKHGKLFSSTLFIYGAAAVFSLGLLVSTLAYNAFQANDELATLICIIGSIMEGIGFISLLLTCVTAIEVLPSKQGCLLLLFSLFFGVIFSLFWSLFGTSQRLSGL